MQKNILFIFSMHIVFSCGTKNESTLSLSDLNLTPQHQSVQLQKGELNISQGLNFTTNLLDSLSTNLREYLSQWVTFNKEEKTKLGLTIDKIYSSNKEVFSLSIDMQGVTIKANDFAGLFYGVQTLSQLLEFSSNNATSLPYIKVEDEPCSAYRGFMLDVSRHFFPFYFVKKQIYLMAHYKLNTFNWHLTNGPGWRLEIKQYPELTNIAAWRIHETLKEKWATSSRKYVEEGSENAYGGYYT